jgi:hypothetical protein
VKNALSAILLSLLVPALALAESSQQTTPPSTPAPASSSTPPSDTPTPAATATDAAKKANSNPLANAVQARTPEEQAAQSGFQLITSLDHYLGAGTFVDTRYYSYLAAWLTVIPQYLFSIGKQRLVGSATLRGTWEYTLPDTETGRRWSVGDIAVGVSAPALFKETAITNIAFSPSVGLTIPVSPESWNAGLITTLRAGITASRSVKTIDFRANVGASGSIFGQPTAGYRNPNISGTGASPRDVNGNLLAICRVGETLCGAAGNNTAFTVSVGGQIQWRATGSLLFYIGYSYFRIWRYSANPVADQFTPQAIDSRGNPVAKAGLGQTDRTSAFFGGSYQLNEHYSLDLGVSNIQAPLTPTGQVRFPFLSLGTWADNGTSLSFSLSAAY